MTVENLCVKSFAYFFQNCISACISKCKSICLSTERWAPVSPVFPVILWDSTAIQWGLSAAKQLWEPRTTRKNNRSENRLRPNLCPCSLNVWMHSRIYTSVVTHIDNVCSTHSVYNSSHTPKPTPPAPLQPQHTSPPTYTQLFAQTAIKGA